MLVAMRRHATAAVQPGHKVVSAETPGPKTRSFRCQVQSVRFWSLLAVIAAGWHNRGHFEALWRPSNRPLRSGAAARPPGTIRRQLMCGPADGCVVQACREGEGSNWPRAEPRATDGVGSIASSFAKRTMIGIWDLCNYR